MEVKYTVIPTCGSAWSPVQKVVLHVKGWAAQTASKAEQPSGVPALFSVGIRAVKGKQTVSLIASEKGHSIALVWSGKKANRLFKCKEEEITVSQEAFWIVYRVVCVRSILLWWPTLWGKAIAMCHWIPHCDAVAPWPIGKRGRSPLCSSLLCRTGASEDARILSIYVLLCTHSSAPVRCNKASFSSLGALEPVNHFG